MSKVTNLILVFSTSEHEDEIIDQIRFFNEDGFFRITSVEDKKLPEAWYGGSRRLECSILIGAYNYLELDKFIFYLKKKVRWERLDLVQIFVKEENDLKFRLIDVETYQ